MIVMKFGGSSVANAEKIKDVANIVKSRLDKKPVVVVSAVKGITDKLIETANAAVDGENTSNLLKEIGDKHDQIIADLNLDKDIVKKNLDEFRQVIEDIEEASEASTQAMDLVQSFGERMSSKLVAAHLNSIGVKAQAFDAWDIGMITNANFGKAEPLNDSYKKIDDHVKKLDLVPIVTGFIGKTPEGTVATLGRGGSDYTAAIIGAAVGSEEIQIWTDVNGVMTSDPRVIKEAKTIPQISFAEASELAYFGAKVLHPKTIIPAMKKDIPVRVLNTYEPTHKGTVIVRKSEKSKEVIKAIACKKSVLLVSIVSTRMIGAHGFLARVFDIFEDYAKSIDMIATSEASISLTVDKEESMDQIAEQLKEIADVKVEKGKAIVCVVGEGMYHIPGIAGKIFTTLGKAKVNVEMISQGASEINVSFIVDDDEADKAVQALHSEYFK
ncbi:lysine-sensitive aspartokinase 3 [Candidatus Woesearchaeota archaeon]|nr:lysine-sensitive aspartokinase 3 [Candidatus Woesearchaeota archaeon]